MSEEEKEAIVQLKHYSNMTAYWKQEEFTNSEIDYYIKLVLNLIEKLQKENREYEYTIAEMVQTRENDFIPKYKVRKEIKELELEGTKQYWTEEVISILENILVDRETNFDITFCSNEKCKNTDCNRNQNNYDMHYVFIKKPFISIADFKKCEFWEENE